MSRFYEITVTKKGTVEMALRGQGGFTRKQISRAKFMENGIKKMVSAVGFPIRY